jgi:DNA-binding NarL/FixJ family response regulator
VSSLQEIIRIASELQATQTRAAELEQQLVRAAKAFGDKAPPAPPRPNRYVKPAKPARADGKPPPAGDRVKQVAELFAAGFEASQIAVKLGISRNNAMTTLWRARKQGLLSNGAAVGAGEPSPGGAPPATR